MNYLEHRLILAFFTSGLSFNVNDVPPQLSDVNAAVQFVPEPDCPQAGSTQAKALKWRGLFFSSNIAYIMYRDSSINTESQKLWPARPTLRKKLAENTIEFTEDNRYLTDDEVNEAYQNHLFYGS